eukprot:2930614-Prymnesium_polylepis.2
MGALNRPDMTTGRSRRMARRSNTSSMKVCSSGPTSWAVNTNGPMSDTCSSISASSASRMWHERTESALALKRPAHVGVRRAAATRCDGKKPPRFILETCYAGGLPLEKLPY